MGDAGTVDHLSIEGKIVLYVIAPKSHKLRRERQLLETRRLKRFLLLRRLRRQLRLRDRMVLQQEEETRALRRRIRKLPVFLLRQHTC